MLHQLFSESKKQIETASFIVGTNKKAGPRYVGAPSGYNFASDQANNFLPIIPIFLKLFGLGESWRILVAERAQIEFNFLRYISACVKMCLPAQYYLLFQRRLFAAYRFETKLICILVTLWPQWKFILKRVGENCLLASSQLSLNSPSVYSYL